MMAVGLLSVLILVSFIFVMCFVPRKGNLSLGMCILVLLDLYCAHLSNIISEICNTLFGLVVVRFTSTLAVTRPAVFASLLVSDKSFSWVFLLTQTEQHHLSMIREYSRTSEERTLWEQYFCPLFEMKGDVGMSLHEKEGEQEDA